MGKRSNVECCCGWFGRRENDGNVLGPCPKCGETPAVRISRKPHAPVIKEAFDARFWRQVDRDFDQPSCWLWTGAVGLDGYGNIHHAGVTLRANRVAWELWSRSPLPQLACVLHRCDERLCVNPAHLFLGDRGDNIRDAVKKGRQSNVRKTHCLRGHPLEGDNVFASGLLHGHRICKVCRRERCARRRQRVA